MRIVTERLLITEFTMDMAEDVHKNSLDEDTRRFVPDEVFETTAEAEKAISFLIAQYGGAEGPFVYPVLTKEGQNIGYVQLAPIDEGWEVGYHIAGEYTGKGYATEATAAFLPQIAEKMHLEQIFGICLEENTASQKVMKKCGFQVIYTGEDIYQGEIQRVIKNIWTQH